MNRVTLEKTQDYLIVKIPLKDVESERMNISSKDQKVIDKAIAEGLYDVKKGYTFGPFKSVKAFKAALKI